MTEPPVGMGPPGDEEPPPPAGFGWAILLAFAGVFSFIVFAVATFLFLGNQNLLDIGTNRGQILLAIVLAGVAFIGGGALCFIRSPRWRGFGIGLMIGWALLSIVSAGVCTGLSRF
ncbi:MAG: hypothetical protein ACRDS0_07510 [Pseudonocardiaceae bacterium]